VSWTALLALSAACYVMKALGPVALAGRTLAPSAARLVGLVAVPVLAALVVVQTVASGDRLVLDARLPALGVAAVLVWRRAPFLAVVLGAAATAAVLRLLT
jgi:hypothetical protein